MRDVAGRFRLAKETAAPPDELSVRVDLPFAAEIADQVEVKRRAVAAAEVFKAHPEREMHRPADLLVEEDVPSEAVDLVVEPERDLTGGGRPLVHAEQRLEIRLSAGGFGGDYAAVLESQPCVVDLAAAEDRGEAEPDRPVDPGLDRARIDLAVGQVLDPVGRPPGPALHDDGEIGVLADDAELTDRAQLGRARLQPLADSAPVANRIGVEDVAGPKNEVLVLLEGHV